MEEWVSYSNEITAQSHKIPYSDPARKISQYMQDLGEGSTFYDFIAKGLTLSKYNWDIRWTAQAVNKYVRAGFDALFCGDGLVDRYSNCSKESQL